MDNIISRKAIVFEVLELGIDDNLNMEETILWQQAINEYRYQIDGAKDLITMLPNFEELPTMTKAEFILELVQRLSSSREEVRLR